MITLIVGVADASFLGSNDFKQILERFDRDLQFAFYSPMAWFLGYRWRRARTSDFSFEFFSDFRFKQLERANVDLLKANLVLGIEQGRLILIRDILLQRLYSDLYRFLDVRSDILGISTRDLCNILLASRLNVPLWVEQDADIWIEKAYKLRITQRSEDLTLPIRTNLRTNPKFDPKAFLSKIISLARRKVDFEDIVEEVTKKARQLLPHLIETKAIILATFEPLPIWEHFDLKERIGLSIILTFIDIAGLSTRKKG